MDFPLKGFVNRAESMRQMLSYLQQVEKCEIAANQPVGALQWGRGSGRTKFHSMLAGSLDLTKEELQPEEKKLYVELRAQLEGYVPIAVTFGHDTFSPKKYWSRDLLLEVAIRALFS